MYQIENKDYKQIYYPETIRKIIDYLDIKDKIIWNDPYLKFIVYDEYEKIKEFRLKADIPQKDFANLLHVEASTLRKWETGESKMSRAELSRQLGIDRCTVERWIRNEIEISRSNYEKLMNFINSYEQKKESTNDTCSMH